MTKTNASASTAGSSSHPKPTLLWSTIFASLLVLNIAQFLANPANSLRISKRFTDAKSRNQTSNKPNQLPDHEDQYSEIILPVPQDIPDFNATEFASTYECDPWHKYTVIILSRNPQVMYIDSFFTTGESEYLKHISAPLLERSRVVADEGIYTAHRTSESAYILEKNNVVKCIESRAAQFANIPLSHVEPLQVVRYSESQKFDSHYDWFDVETAAGVQAVQKGGNRLITFFGYLQEKPEGVVGGGTSFPWLNLTIEPIKNNAVFWYNLLDDGSGDERVLHSGDAVSGWQKWGCNLWIREREYDTADADELQETE